MQYIIFGLILSYIYSKLFLPQNPGEYPKFTPTIYPILYKGMFIIPIKQNLAVHIHHWMIFLFISILCCYIKLPELIFGVSLGLMIQGLNYLDSFSENITCFFFTFTV